MNTLNEFFPWEGVNININLEALIQMVNDYLYAEEELKLFLRTWKGGWWQNKTAQEREDYTKYTERSSKLWGGLSTMCRAFNIDVDRLISFVKCLNRQERKCKYQKCFTSIRYRDERSAVKYLFAPEVNGYFESTGRKDNSAVA